MNRYTARLLTLGLVLLVLLAACGGPSAPPEPAAIQPTDAPTAAADTSDATPTAADESAPEPTIVTTPTVEPSPLPPIESTTADGRAKVTIFVGLGTGTDPGQIEAQDALAEEFNASHDKIAIEFLIVPYDQAPERYLTTISGGNPPQLVGPIGVEGTARFFDTWADITPFIKADSYDMSDFYGPTVDLHSYPDKVVGLPLGIYPSFIFYNEDLFDAAGVDYPTHSYSDKSWTLAKLREMAMQLTLDQNDKNAADPDFDAQDIKQWGYDDSWATTRGAMVMWQAANMGLPTSADYKTSVINSPEWGAGMKWFSDGIWKDHFIASLAGQQTRTGNGKDPFGGGETAMWFSHSWFMASGLQDLAFKYDFAPVPFNDKGNRIARLNADTFAIPKNAKNQKEAWEVMKWLMEPQRNQKLCEIYGCLPARKSLETAFRAELAKQYPGADLDVIFSAIDYLDKPNHEAYVPEFGQIQDSLNNYMSLVYAGQEKDAQKVMDEANAEVQKLLDNYWATHQ